MTTMDSAPALSAAKARSKLLHWFMRHLWFALVVLLPVALATIYYGFIASDQYVSESRFVIKSPNSRPQAMSGLAGVILSSGLTGGAEQANEVLDYIRSRSALADLGRKVNLRATFGMRGVDALSRYPKPFQDDLFENLYKYYGKMVDVRVDNDTQAVVLTVKAFTAKDARNINADLLDLSEGFVNQLNDRARAKAIAEATFRVSEAENRTREARLALQQYRNRQALLDPAAQGSGVLDVTNRLIIEQSALRAQLDMIRQAAPSNPSIPALTQRIAALGEQIDAQTRRAVGSDDAIASKLSQFEKLKVEQEFATQMLTTAQASLESARAEAVRQQFYLERVVSPNTPDLPLLPKRLLQILVVAVTTLCLYFIGWMLVVGILEHAPED